MADKDYTPEQIIKWAMCCSRQNGKSCFHCPLVYNCRSIGGTSASVIAWYKQITTRAAKMLNDALEREKVRQWISVEDRLPEESGRY